MERKRLRLRSLQRVELNKHTESALTEEEMSVIFNKEWTALKTDWFPNAVRGFQGMNQAHEILKDHESYGVLIGSLAEDVWDESIVVEDFRFRKDVNVLVLNMGFPIDKPFEAGIDWWLPRFSGKRWALEGQTYDGKIWSNGHGDTLNFGVQNERPLREYGLYLLCPWQVRKIREIESAEVMSKTGLEYEGWFINKEHDHYMKTLRSRVRDRDYFNGGVDGRFKGNKAMTNYLMDVYGLTKGFRV